MEARHEWHEIETLLSAPAAAGSARDPRHGISSFAFVAAALVLGGGMLVMTLMGPRTDCASCHGVTATVAPAAEAPRHVDTAALAPAPDTALTEGRSVASPVLDMTGSAASAPDSAASDPVTPEQAVSPLPHRHRHHHHAAHP